MFYFQSLPWTADYIGPLLEKPDFFVRDCRYAAIGLRRIWDTAGVPDGTPL
jgi:hypothetical protein